jgi:hypothetical protein
MYFIQLLQFLSASQYSKINTVTFGLGHCFYIWLQLFRRMCSPGLQSRIKDGVSRFFRDVNNHLHAVISQKTEILIFRAVKMLSHLFFQHVKKRK